MNLTVESGELFALLGDSIIKNKRRVKEKINLSPQETAAAPDPRPCARIRS